MLGVTAIIFLIAGTTAVEVAMSFGISFHIRGKIELAIGLTLSQAFFKHFGQVVDT